MKKKLLFKLWQFPRLSETFLIAQILTAIKCNYEVKILVDEINDIQKSTHMYLIEKYKLIDKIIVEDYEIPDNRTKRIFKAIYILLINFKNLNKINSFLRNFEKFQLKNLYVFHFYFNLGHYDIIHVQYGTNAKPLDILKNYIDYPTKLIVSFHGHDLYFPINGVIENNGYYNILFQVADLLVANTPFLKNTLKELGADETKIKTIPVSVNTGFFNRKETSSITKRKFRIITVGRLEKFKGQLFGLKCVKKLKEIGYDFHFTLIGTGSQERSLKQYVEENKLNEVVSLEGRKSQLEIRDYLRRHDLFLMTSVRDPEYGFESQGLVSAEAQACGLPVVAFDSGGVRYTLKNEETGFLVPEYDINAMVNRIIELIEHPEMRIQMGENAIQYMNKEFSQNRIDEVWCQTYKSLLPD